ncbi:AAA family ATPase [Candidatus Nomurabacteria bacterium]|nr:AAA family ATPase [Candidatus Nomurabacteria bacterium]
MKLKNKSFIILIDGPMGSGKTTVANILHLKLKRTSCIGLDKIKRFLSDFKRNPADNEISRNVVLAMTQEYLKQGINVIIEQGMKKEQIETFKKIAKKYCADIFIYQLYASKSLLQERVLARPGLIGKPKITKTRIERNYRIHTKNKHLNVPIFNSEELAPEQIANRILKEIRNL